MEEAQIGEITTKPSLGHNLPGPYKLSVALKSLTSMLDVDCFL